MALAVVKPQEVIVNDLLYRLGGDGLVRTHLASVFAPKQVTGDYNKDSDPNRSSWVVIGNQTGGIGIEDMDESIHAKRSWWSSVNDDYPGTTFLRPLASSITLPTVLTGLAITYGGTNITGAYTRDDDATGWSNDFRSKPFMARVSYVNNTAATATVTFTLNDGVSDLMSKEILTNGNGTFSIGLFGVLGATATRVRISVVGVLTSGTVSVTTIAYTLYTLGSSLGTITVPPADYGGNTYFAAGAVLLQVNSSGVVVPVMGFSANITSIISSVGSCLYVFIGDTQAYRYMNSTGFWVTTDSVEAYFGVHWDNKLVKISSLGQAYTAATPNAASPTWTTKGLLDVTSLGTLRGLITYANVSGADQVYARTTKGLFIHDFTNAVWLNTELQLPEHTDNGKGCVVANGKLYFSAGLSVWEYSLINESLVIRDIGPTKEDGLPDEYNGSIVYLAGGYGGAFFALVDASLISSSNYSTILRYEKDAWKVVWVDGTANEAQYSGIASPNVAYRLWWEIGSALNYIPLDRAKRNPIKVTTSTYIASGIYLSPWFDADWLVGDKLALATRALALGTTANETITIRYRIDKTNTDLGTGWTTIDTLVLADAGVESIVKFGSSLGTTFKAIQFRVNFARGGTNTATPNLVYLVLEYEKIITAKWSWEFVVNCSEPFGARTPTQMLDALITASESKTLVTFYYKDTAKYVRIFLPDGTRQTGVAPAGQYRVIAMEK